MNATFVLVYYVTSILLIPRYIALTFINCYMTEQIRFTEARILSAVGLCPTFMGATYQLL